MTLLISITEDQLSIALRGFLLSCFPTAKIISGQQNRIAMPMGVFIVFTTVNTVGLSTNVVMPVLLGATAAANLQHKEWIVQIDCYGDNAAFDTANAIAQLTKTEFATDYFSQCGVDLMPLYATNPKNTNFTNTESQYEDSYTFEMHMQYNPIITTPQQYADTLALSLVEVDAKFPPRGF